MGIDYVCDGGRQALEKVQRRDQSGLSFAVCNMVDHPVD